MRQPHLASLTLAVLGALPLAASAAVPSFTPWTLPSFAQFAAVDNVATADLDGDGQADVIAVGNGSVCVVPSTFARGAIDPLDGFPSSADCYLGVSNNYWQSVAVADFNGDGKPDIASAFLNTNTVVVLLNTTLPGGAIRLGAPTSLALSASPNAIAVADFDGDGRPDIATVDLDHSISILLNTTPAGASTASFAAPIRLPAPYGIVIAAADFNGDGKPDLAIAGGGTVSVLLNATTPATGLAFGSAQTAGTFTAAFSMPTLAVADFDGNGRPDIAVPDKDGTIGVLFNHTPAGAAQTAFAATPLNVGHTIYTLTAADLDGDGVPDLLAVSADSGGNGLCVLHNRTAPGAASFGGFDLQRLALGSNVGGIAVGDFNGDGKPDVVESDYGIGPELPHLDLALNTTGLPAAELDQQGITGSWYDPATSGQGLEIEVYPNLGANGDGLLSGGWFTYGADAGAGRRWFLLSGAVSVGETVSEIGIYQPLGGAFDTPPPGSAPANRIGNATIAFSDCNHGVLHYEMQGAPDHSLPFPYGRSGLIPLTRLLPRPGCASRSDGGTNAAPASLLSGNWYNPATPGQGFIFDMSPEAQTLFAAWYTFEPGDAQGGLFAPQNWYTLQAPFVDAGAPLHDIPIVQTSGGVFDDPTATTSIQVGSADLTFQSCAAMTLTYRMTGGAAAGKSGTIPLQRIGPTPAGCALH